MIMTPPTSVVQYQEVAQFYDLHAPQNGEWIADFVQFAIQKHAKRSVNDLFELGIGTGRVAIPLAKRGYRITGNDGSSYMLDICRQKATAQGLTIDLKQEWFQDFQADQAYDTVLAVFSAIGFLVETETIRRCIRALLNAVRPGGIVILDVPNSYQGLQQSWVGCRVERFEADGVTLERFLQLIPDLLHGVVRYRDTGLIEQADGTRATYQEEYRLRMFTWPEMQLILEPIPFHRMTCYCNWTDREPLQAPHERLIVVLEKSEQ